MIKQEQKEEELLASYEKLRKPILELDEKIKVIKGSDKFYKGIDVLYSRLNYHPKIMFIGINPGSGYYKETNEPKYDIKPAEYSEHLSKYSKWQLAKSLQKFMGTVKKDFKGDISYKFDIVFMNVFPFATTNENELHQLFSLIKKHDIKIDKECFDFIRQMTIEVNPQIIICLGKSAFDFFTKENECCDIDNKMLTGNLTNGNIPIFGIRRNRSFLLKTDVEQVACKVSNLLKKY